MFDLTSGSDSSNVMVEEEHLVSDFLISRQSVRWMY